MNFAECRRKLKIGKRFMLKRKFKVIYWLNGNQCVKEIEASSKYEAKQRFYFTTVADDIIRIEEVKE